MTTNGTGVNSTSRWIIGGLVTGLVLAVMFSAQIGWAQVQRNADGIDDLKNTQISIETKLDILVSDRR